MAYWCLVISVMHSERVTVPEQSLGQTHKPVIWKLSLAKVRSLNSGQMEIVSAGFINRTIVGADQRIILHQKMVTVPLTRLNMIVVLANGTSIAMNV